MTVCERVHGSCFISWKTVEAASRFITCESSRWLNWRPGLFLLNIGAYSADYFVKCANVLMVYSLSFNLLRLLFLHAVIFFIFQNVKTLNSELVVVF